MSSASRRASFENIVLGLVGCHVRCAGGAHASQKRATNPRVTDKQRQRCKHGRFQLSGSRTLPRLRIAPRRRNAVCLDLALGLLVLPFSYVALNVGGFADAEPSLGGTGQTASRSM